ncbi:MAG: peptide chain release factor N(5)-glutamine methyltransferase [Syntrophales bacterium]|nr:peptide chain release factor N(5)-glutamine methyltransferase [Syntrophales bacterium]
MVTFREALRKGTILLQGNGIPSPRLDAEVLLSHVINKDRTYLYSHIGDVLPEEQWNIYKSLLERRLAWEPVAYIVGRKEFWTLNLRVNRHVMIPRPETEHLVGEVLRVVSGSWNGFLRILDIGTGSGAIALAIAWELKDAPVRVYGVDISQEAIHVANDNARELGLSSKVYFVVGDLTQPFRKLFDILVSNPPYIPDEVYDNLSPSITVYEPPIAFKGGTDGLFYYRRIVKEANLCLKEGGWVLMEINYDQGDRIREMLIVENYTDIEIRKDYSGFDRVIIARKGR